jgi:2-oxoglutarate dehydrogenase E1 component
MQDSTMELLWSSSHISGANAVYVEALYDAYLCNPESVPEKWREYFNQLPQVNGYGSQQETPHSTVRGEFISLGKQKCHRISLPSTTADHAAIEHERKQAKVTELVRRYHSCGHRKANIDPLGLRKVGCIDYLDFHDVGFVPSDLDLVFQTKDLFFGKNTATLKQIIADLEKTYCGSIGAEITHLTELDEVKWLREYMESVSGKPNYSPVEKICLLERLTAAEGLEKHLDSKYPGTKRFGLEGGESFIPMVDALIKRAGTYGAKEIVLGMAHRGRLNTLVNVFGKKPADLFEEFEGKKLIQTSGDVKYHQGFSSNLMTPSGELHIVMAFNPSHLEIVSPVVEGSVRARQDRREDKIGDSVVPLVVHGDAAFSAQGVVMETFQMSQTPAYKTGGTIHIVINNQVGFTTSNPADARSTEYCTDVAKFINAPIFHVNGDDPEAVLFTALLAMDYRHAFKKDVVIDLVCYRRRGHNETDEPSATQPLMYQVIRKHKTTRALYEEKLIAEGSITKEQADQITTDYRAALDRGDVVVAGLVSAPDKTMFVDWSPYLDHVWQVPCDTSYSLKKLREIAHKACDIPDDIQMQPQVKKLYQDRSNMASGSLAVNWGMAEILAYATLIEQSVGVRITGQDVARGTFSHRHAVIHSQKDGRSYVPLANLFAGQRPFIIHDSLLSEEAVLAFEYGYSSTRPDFLVIWEAQFGDFANGAQVVIDQFITSGEHKWGRLSGLTMLLPHGYEGQGPEHSSARLERFMQLCAEHNFQVCIPTTPAQVFHMLRRQALRPMRRPLVVMSPKWILRHQLATSTLEELAEGQFYNVLTDEHVEPGDVGRVVLCSGKVYYHLLEERIKRSQKNVALVRLEQIYPFPEDELEKVFESFKGVDDVVWCQEEPMNQGAWYHSQHHIRRVLEKVNNAATLNFVGREASAAPAAGYMSLHLEQQKRFIDQALTLAS